MQKGSLYPTVFFLSLLLKLTLSANGQMLEVYPEEITLELTGGCSVTKEIYVNFLGTEDTTIFISTEVLPDNDGINITYSVASPFIVKPNIECIINMTINTSMLLAPGIYTIISNFLHEDESHTTEENNNGHRTFTHSTNQPEEDTEPDDGIIILDDPDIPDGADDPNISDSTDDTNNERPFLFIILIIGLVFFLLILLSFLLLRKRKAIQQPSGGETKNE